MTNNYLAYILSKIFVLYFVKNANLFVIQCCTCTITKHTVLSHTIQDLVRCHTKHMVLKSFSFLIQLVVQLLDFGFKRALDLL